MLYINEKLTRKIIRLALIGVMAACILFALLFLFDVIPATGVLYIPIYTFMYAQFPVICILLAASIYKAITKQAVWVYIRTEFWFLLASILVTFASGFVILIKGKPDLYL